MTPSDGSSPAAPEQSVGPVDPALLRQRSIDRALALLDTLPLPPGTALVATGSLARRDMTSYSDLDLILLHPDDREVTPAEAEGIWYPIWDAKYRLNYAVRTLNDCVDMISADSTAALALLELHHLRGNASLSAATRAAVLRRWRTEISRRFDALVQTAIERWRRSGSVVTMTRPDLKNGRGGLRDIALLKALALGNLADLPDLSVQHRLLLDIRTRLHLHTRRARDVLDPEFAADVATDLGYHDRYGLAAALADAARTIDDAVTGALAVARGVVTSRARGRRGSGGSGLRRPLDVDVVDDGGIIRLSRQPDLTDAGLLLRVSSAAARTGLKVSESTWRQLARLPEPPETWPKVMVDDFIATLSSPEHSRRVINRLDHEGLWERLVPWWSHIRNRLPRERTHIHTIDQHLLVTVAGCASASVTVARPDLLLLAALFHDLGKGYPQPHETVGAGFAARLAATMGFHYRDRVRLQTLVAEHTTVARLALSRDPEAEQPLDELLNAVNHDLLTLNLLLALTEADAKATGPGVWNQRLSTGLAILGRRARHRLTDLQPREPMVFSATEINMHVIAGDPGAGVVNWRGDYLRGSIRVLAAIAAKSWNIEETRMVRRTDGSWHARFAVRSLVTMSLDSADLVRTYRSGVHSMLPAITAAPTAVVWHGRVLEVRTSDQVGAVGALIAVLPELKWLISHKLGATMLVQCALIGEIDRDKVERDVTRALTTS